MIENRPDKDRVKCPFCGAFVVEIKPRLMPGQTIGCKCPKCHKDIEVIKK